MTQAPSGCVKKSLDALVRTLERDSNSNSNSNSGGDGDGLGGEDGDNNGASDAIVVSERPSENTKREILNLVFPEGREGARIG